MTDVRHTQDERLSRQQAAERLIDIAYTLTAGRPLELSGAGRRVVVPAAGELRLERILESDGDQATFALRLTWAAPRDD